MSSRDPVTEKPGRTFDSAYSFSFAIAIGLILFIGGLVISLTLSDGSSVGLIFGIPLLLAGLIVGIESALDVVLVVGRVGRAGERGGIQAGM